MSLYVEPPLFDEERAEKDINEDDWFDFNRLTSVKLSDEEIEAAIKPGQIDQNETRLMAIHWHPEWVPLNLIETRLKTSFPQAKDSLVIPTQHNRIMTMGPWAGVEADVYAPSYGLKIQLLIHLKKQSLDKTSTLMDMMEKTFQYRVKQLMDILNQLANPDQAVAREMKRLDFSQKAVDLARFYATRLKKIIIDSKLLGTERGEMLKNRLLSDYIGARSTHFDPLILEQALSLIKTVKTVVKSRLDPSRFFTAAEVIEEARGLGAGIVIPHPPQFWPVLLDDLDIDGWEIWNPSTPRHTIFLIESMNRRIPGSRPLLAFMGDDTHMSSKIRQNYREDKATGDREIGFQPPWKEPEIEKTLALYHQSRERTMDEYRSRLE